MSSQGWDDGVPHVLSASVGLEIELRPQPGAEASAYLLVSLPEPVIAEGGGPDMVISECLGEPINRKGLTRFAYEASLRNKSVLTMVCDSSSNTVSDVPLLPSMAGSSQLGNGKPAGELSSQNSPTDDGRPGLTATVTA